jgi:hypothetical protein
MKTDENEFETRRMVRAIWEFCQTNQIGPENQLFQRVGGGEAPRFAVELPYRMLLFRFKMYHSGEENRVL